MPPEGNTRKGAFVIPRKLRWPHQSMLGDLFHFVALNPFAMSGVTRAVKTLPHATRDMRSHIDGFHRETIWVLHQIHDGPPASASWAGEDWIPDAVKWRTEDLQIGRSLRFCRKCLALGYHTPIQQLPWITHCPIHLEVKLTGPCARCARADFHTYVVRSSPNHCGIGGASIEKVLDRGEIPTAAAARIERYLAFVGWCKTVTMHEITSPDRDPGPICGLPIDIGRFGSAERDAAVCVSLLIHLSPYKDLRKSIARLNLDTIRAIDVPLRGSGKYVSRFAKPFVADVPHEPDTYDPERGDVRQLTRSLSMWTEHNASAHVTTSTRAVRTGDGAEDGYVGQLLARRHVQSLLLEAVSTQGCKAGVECLQAHRDWRPLDSACMACHAMHLWKRHVFGDGGPSCYSMVLWPTRLGPRPPKVRPLPVEASPQADRLLFHALSLDLQVYFLTIRDWYLNRGFDPLRSQLTLRTRFDSVVGIERGDVIHFFLWDPPDVRAEIKRTRLHGACELRRGPGRLPRRPKNGDTPARVERRRTQQSKRNKR